MIERRVFACAAALGLLLGCTSKELTLEVKLSVADEGTADEKITVTFATEPKATIICRSCKGDLHSTAADEKGTAKVTFDGEPGETSYCFRADFGPARASKDVCAKVPRTPSLVVDGLRYKCKVVECAGTFSSGGLTIDAVAPGTKVEFDGKTKTVAPRDSFHADIASRFAKATLDQLAGDKVIAKLPAVFTFSGGEKLTLPVTLSGASLRYLLWQRLDAVKTGPVALPGDKADAEPVKARAVAFKRPQDEEILGKGTSFAELGLVAFGTREPRVVEKCAYTGEKGGSAQINRIASDFQVKVYDRFTGKLRTQKSFAASTPPACSASVELKEGQTRGEALTTYGDEEAAKAWLVAMTE